MHQHIKEERIKKMEKFADLLISTSAQDIRCDKHKLILESDDQVRNCIQCQNLQEKAEKYQKHKHTFSVFPEPAKWKVRPLHSP